MVMKIVAAGEEVVEQESDFDLESRARTVAVNRQQDLDRRDELRQLLEESPPREQRFTHETEVQSLEIAKTAVDHLRRGRRCLRAERPLVEDGDVVVASRELPGDSGAVDAPTDHGNAVQITVHVVSP